MFCWSLARFAKVRREFNNVDAPWMWFSVTTALVYMLTASVFFALSGVAVHGLGSGGWDIALLSRALFGLPFAIFIFLSGPKA